METNKNSMQGNGRTGQRDWMEGQRGRYSEGREPQRDWDQQPGQAEERSGQGGRRTRWQREAMTARDIMTAPVRSVTAQSSVREAAKIMKEENVGIIPVVDEDRKLVGVVTDRDLVVRLLAGDRSTDNIKLQELMSDDVEAVTPEEEIREVLELMGRRQVRRIPVVDQDDSLIGIISLGDIANRADYDEELQDALEQISARRSFWNRRWL